MKTSVIKSISVLLIAFLLISTINLQIFSYTAQAANNEKVKLDKVQESPAEKIKNKLKKEDSLSEEFIQTELDKGYTLEEIEKAIGEKNKDKKLSYEQSMERIKKQPVNNSKQTESTITNTASFSAMSAPENPIQHVNTRPNEAPFSVNLENETISTLSGSLVIGGSDMTLPGRNGLSFTLSRTYESGSSQFYPLNYTTGKTMEESLFPIGKGWSWNISFIEMVSNKKYLHLAGAGTYEIDDNALKGYPWKDIAFSADTSVIVNNLTSAFRVKSISNISQYFASDGKLIQISDAYNNKVLFHYNTQGIYGSVLSSVIDAIGNTMNITYTESKVTITYGIQTVTYIKKIESGKELLFQVWDSLNRATTYDYAISPAQYNIQGEGQNNPYALLTGVTFPTGGKSAYSYDTTPIYRSIGENMSNQVYRIKTRENKILFTDGTSEIKNKKTITYTGDMGSANKVDLTFSTTINDGQSISVYNNKKDYIDEYTSAAFYNTKVTSTAGTMQTTTDYTYDEARRIDEPIRVESKNVNTSTLAQSTPVVTLQTFDDYKNVTSTVNPFNVMITNEFDPTTHWLTSSSEPISATQTRYTGYTYNTKGDVVQADVKETNSAGTLLQQIKYEDIDIYGNIRRVIVKDDTRDLITLYEYGADYLGAYPTKKSVSVTNIDGIATTIESSYQYNLANGNLIKLIDGKGYETQYHYDALGRITKTIHPDLSTISVVYDDFTNILTVTDEVGITSIAKWNPLGWKTEVGLNEGEFYKAKEKYGYDQYGRATWSEDAIGNRTKVDYDLWNRQTLVTYADTYTSSVIYDDITNKKTSIDPENNQARETYDILGRVVKSEEIKPNGTTIIVGEFTYNNSGNVLVQKDAKQQSTSFGYNTLSQLTKVTNAKLETTQFSYSMAGNMKQITHPDLTTILKQYDELGRVIKEVDDKGHFDKYYFDANSNMSKRIDRKGKEFTFDYNNRNFLMHKISLDETIGFTYDNSGKRLNMSDATGITTNTYNPYTSGLNQVTYPDGRSIQYDYDTQGQRRQMTDPFGGNVYYSYDARNRLSGVGTAYDDYDAEYTYFKNGQLSQIQQKNGITSTYAYDGIRLDTLVHQKADSTVLNSFVYDYDPNGNITNRVDAGSTKSFTYDPLNRIDTSSQFAETYTYDNRGNRSSIERNKLFENINTDLVYDDRDRLEQVTTSDGKVVSYTYNGDNLLYERTENGETTRYYYDGGSIIAEATVISGVAELKQRYIRGRGIVASEDPYLNKAYYLHNGHGDVEQLRDDTGNTQLNAYSYDIWGNSVIEKETIHNPFRYSGELWDDTTLLQYLRTRWYDPSEGRFINEDTYKGQIDNPLSLNLYTYVYNNPLIYLDPSGQDAREVMIYKLTGKHRYDSKLKFYMHNFVDLAAWETLSLDDWYALLNPEDAEEVVNSLQNIVIGFIPMGKAGKMVGKIGKYTDEAGDLTRAAIKKHGCNCFTAGTKVLIDEGEKPIEDIEVGDSVLSKNEETGEVAYKDVVRLYTKISESIYNIHVGEQVVEATGNHPFWVDEKGWVNAEELQIGDLLVQSSGNKLIIDKIVFEPRQEQVYNFEVADFHTYFVSELGIWVHNENCVYIAKNASGDIQYVGITNDVARRGAEHLKSKGISIEPLMQGLSRTDSRAVEQALIEIHGLGKNGGSLQNKINSISKSNETYAEQLQQGYDLLKSIGYK